MRHGSSSDKYVVPSSVQEKGSPVILTPASPFDSIRLQRGRYVSNESTEARLARSFGPEVPKTSW